MCRMALPFRHIRANGHARRVTALAVACSAVTLFHGIVARGPRTLHSPAFLASAGAVSGGLGAISMAGSVESAALGRDLDQSLLLAGETFIAPIASEGPDSIFWFYVINTILFVTAVIYLATKPYWDERFLIEKINAAKLKQVTQEDTQTPVDQYELARLYVQLKDYPSAIAEFEEVEEDFEDVRDVLDPEDTMGALAQRAMLHNSKGYALMKLEPPRTAQARREFVRSVTFWPEYPEALLNIGRELIKRKRFDTAVRTLNAALKWQPAYPLLIEAAQQAREGLEVQEAAMEEEDENEYV